MNATAPAEAADLREIGGPSAIGGGWRRFFSLMWLIAVNKFKVTYVGTVLGYVWTLVRPLMLFGVLLFTFFQEATQQALTSLVQEEGVVRKMQFPRLAIPLASVTASLFTLGVNMVAVFVFILAYGVGPYWTWLLLPVLLLPLVVITSALAALLSALQVRYRDMAIIWQVTAQALFYATPVLYTLSFVPHQFRWLILLNPLTPIFLQARHWIIDPSAPSAVAAAGGVGRLLPAAAIFITICVLSVWVFNREAPRMAEEL